MSRAILFITAVIFLTALFFRLKETKQTTKTPTTQNSVEVTSKQTITPVATSSTPEAKLTTAPTSSPAPTTSSTPNNFSLTITSPQNNSTSTKSSVLVSGTTAPHAQIYVNEYDITADLTGHFSKEVPLEEGENVIYVLAHDANGNDAEAELVVIYESGQYE